ncbi:hypothetical protein [Trichormus variabilis]|uniref:Uncharacterized protein n=1 Tax=Trichormus variabilis SAG 1403-4b TaxID=447716 RepID=A0A433V168_ANAVA|nr:hypothetical protein [Trichormus variabilis]MBD2627347.1 hypothetical protein [Trichormus variabilis FACHB-164]RUS99855.1 hypothetical protein DSM107003_04390 [Trichormus variabilis SAG 1403-4b]
MAYNFAELIEIDWEKRAVLEEINIISDELNLQEEVLNQTNNSISEYYDNNGFQKSQEKKDTQSELEPDSKIMRFFEKLPLNEKFSLNGINEFFSAFSELICDFEKLELMLSVEVLREVIRIAGWVSPHWQEIYQIFPNVKRN